MFIKDLNVGETWANYTMSYVHHYLGDVHMDEFSPWNAAYLKKESFKEDIEIDTENFTNQRVVPNMMKGVVKYYA